MTMPTTQNSAQIQEPPVSKQPKKTWSILGLESIPRDSQTWNRVEAMNSSDLNEATVFEKRPYDLAELFPSTVEPTSYGGLKLVSTEDVPALTRMQRFAGPLVAYTDPRLTDYDRRYVLNIYDPPKYESVYGQTTERGQKRYAEHPLDAEGWLWLLPITNARYCNHACVPNCVIADDFYVLTIRPVKAGEELTFLYNKSGNSDGEPGHEVQLKYGDVSTKWYWDPLWSFECACGHLKCQGQIDSYRNVDEYHEQDIPQDVKEVIDSMLKSKVQ
ncbi:hypothetical protein MIR68_008701 [Amoeboaphelidium protococcarum]|nr:hypothetical protein MIR68_008701 [Amoeboaphelidium protococcarum]